MSTPSTSPLRDYVFTTLTEIQDGITNGGQLHGPVQFELNTVTETVKGGKIDIRVLNLGADATAQQTQKVSFAVSFPSEAEIASEAAIKAKADYERAYNEKISQALIHTEVRIPPR
ncbi:MAG: hypothetical protein WCX22_08270 [Methanoregula sp.]